MSGVGTPTARMGHVAGGEVAGTVVSLQGGTPTPGQPRSTVLMGAPRGGAHPGEGCPGGRVMVFVTDSSCP